MKKTSALALQNHELKNLNLILSTDLFKMKELVMSPIACNSALRRLLFSTRRTKSYDEYVLDVQRATLQPRAMEEMMPAPDTQRKKKPTPIIPKLNLTKAQPGVREAGGNAVARDAQGINLKKPGIPPPDPVKQGRIDEFIKLTKEKDKYLILFQSERQKNVKIRKEIESTLNKIDAYAAEAENLKVQYQKNNEVIAKKNHRVKFFKELYNKYMAIMAKPAGDKGAEVDHLLKYLLNKYKLTKADLEVPPETSPKTNNLGIANAILPDYLLGRDHNQGNDATGNENRLSERGYMPKDTKYSPQKGAKEPQRQNSLGNISLSQAKAHLLNMARELEFLSSIPVSELTKRYLAGIGTVRTHKKSSSDMAALFQTMEEKPMRPVIKLTDDPRDLADRSPGRRAVTLEDPFNMSNILNTTNNVFMDGNPDFSLMMDR